MNNQLKSVLEAAQKKPNAISEERNALGCGVYLRGTRTVVKGEKSLGSKLCGRSGRNRPGKRLFPIHLIWRLIVTYI